MHKSVLLEKSIEYLNLNSDSIIVDCTLGYGGHSSEILKRIPSGHLYSFDQDSEAIKYSKNRLSLIANNYTIIKSNFVNIKEELKKLDVDKVDGILYDLGVSSPQLDNDERGFSFHKDAKLDMRMDREQKLTAYEVVNTYSKEELAKIFYKYGEDKSYNVVNDYSEIKLAEIIFKYGEEKFARKIAKKIVESRPINTTLELVEVIKNAVPMKYKKEHHPARKTFQAIRIEVNNELEVFKKSLYDALDLLNINGRICVITFHSLEDRICKEIFKSVSTVSEELKNLPIIPKEYEPKFMVIKVISPTDKEISENRRSRSAKLRVIKRIG